LQQVACFDTAFHRGLDPVYQRFPIPDIGNGIHRYGFHGLSFEHVASMVDEPGMRIVIAHLGSGASICAVRDGCSINTSMSLTPLDGLMMATRCGAVDPGLLLYLQKSMGFSVADLEDMLYHKSGLLGVSGVSGDMRTLLAASAPDSRLAVDQFCARAAEHIAAMATSLGGLDMIVFTGGIGENSFAIRERICERLRWLGAELSSRTNRQGAEYISVPESRVSIRVVPTDEECVIARHTAKLAANWSDSRLLQWLLRRQQALAPRWPARRSPATYGRSSAPSYLSLTHPASSIRSPATHRRPRGGVPFGQHYNGKAADPEERPCAPSVAHFEDRRTK
jgi:acetate kinase